MICPLMHESLGYDLAVSPEIHGKQEFTLVESDSVWLLAVTKHACRQKEDELHRQVSGLRRNSPGWEGRELPETGNGR